MHHLGAGGAMWVYADLNALAFLFAWRYRPELKGRSHEEVENALRQDHFTPQHFATEPTRCQELRATA
jgi:hypothetical protein